MKIKLCRFSKRQNSTKKPSGTGTEVWTTFDCWLKNPTSIVDPVVVMEYSDTTQYYNYNYAYIQEFDNRYYFIRDIVSVGKTWELSLTTDILATYKTQIGDSSMYVLRAAAAYDGDLVDDYYPIGVTHTNSVTLADNPLVVNGSNAYADVNGGCFILGIVGATGVIYSANAVYGSVHYFAFTRANLMTLVSKLLDNNIWNNNLDASDMSIELQKSIIDPMQFIKSCMWVPVPYSSMTGTEFTTLWAFGIQFSGITCKEVDQNPPHIVFNTSISIPKHPLAATRGVYMNCEPFSRYQLLYPPFGLFDLDTTAMCSGTTLSVGAEVDLITGAGRLGVTGETDGKFLVFAKSQVGVPVQLAQVAYDYVGAASGYIGGVAGIIGSALSANFAGVAISTAGLVGTAANAMRPTVTSIGGNGGYADLSGRIHLIAQFYHMPGEDNTNAGRPLCETRQLSTLSGYQKILDGDVAIPGTAGEQAAVKAFLEGGYFYE